MNRNFTDPSHPGMHTISLPGFGAVFSPLEMCDVKMNESVDGGQYGLQPGQRRRQRKQ